MLGGGRYDGLAEALGARCSVPAIGARISHLSSYPHIHHPTHPSALSLCLSLPVCVCVCVHVCVCQGGLLARSAWRPACSHTDNFARKPLPQYWCVNHSSIRHPTPTHSIEVLSLADTVGGSSVSSHSLRVAETLRDFEAPWYVPRMFLTPRWGNAPEHPQGGAPSVWSASAKSAQASG